MDFSKLKPGLYRHYKGGLYRVISTAKHSETLEDMVFYVDAGDESKCWVRPLAMWDDVIETADFGKVKRFIYIDN